MVTSLIAIVGVYIFIGLLFSIRQWKIDTRYLADSYGLFLVMMILWPFVVVFYIQDKVR